MRIKSQGPNLQLSEDARDFLQDGVHAVSHRHRVLPVVVGHASVVLLHGHGESAQFLQLKAASRGEDGKNEMGVRFHLPSLTSSNGCFIYFTQNSFTNGYS